MELNFTLYSNKSQMTLSINFDESCDYQEIYNYIFDFLDLFNGKPIVNNETINIEIISQQILSQEMKEKLYLFIEKYKAKDKNVYKIRSFLNKLDIGNYFFLIPYHINDIPQYNRCLIDVEITALNNGLEVAETLDKFEQTSKSFLEKYEINGKSAESKYTVGEPDKTKRVCRFCKRDSTQTTFKKKAHAISESLGNRHLLLAEECDKCNEFFSQSLEKDFLINVRFFNTLYGIKNKDRKIPKIKQNNYKIWNASDSGDISPINNLDSLDLNQPTNQKNLIIINAYNENDFENTMTIPLKSDEAMTPKNMYKCLVKFALSVLDTCHISNFHATANWLIKEGEFNPKLPKLCTLLTPNDISINPVMLVYLRKDNDINLPYAVGEFHYTCFKYVFIIPIDSEQELDFSEEKNFDNFRKFFNHYQFDENNWLFQDLNSDDPVQYTLNIKFEPSNRNKEI